MNKKQLCGLLRFHKAAYKAYKASGQIENANQARARLLSVYLQIRSIR